MPDPVPVQPAVHSRLLDALFAVSTVSLLLTGVDMALQPDDAPVRGAVCVVVAMVLVALWVIRRRVRRRGVVSVAFAVAAMVATLAGDNILAMLSTFCSILLLTLDISAAAGVAMALLAAAVPVGLYATASRGIEWVVTQTVGTTGVLAFMVAFALLLRHSAIDSAERAALLLERDAANLRLEVANAKLRSSIETEKELVLAQERARAARELHDGLGHRLTLVTMSLDFADRSRDSSPERAWEEVGSARRTTQEAMAEMRLWVRALNPVSVGGVQGVAALDAVADAFRGTGLDVRFEAVGDDAAMSDAVLLFCHRFVQEGLTNVLRHAHARSVQIGVMCDDAVHIRLEDDGGSVPQVIEHGFGLRSLADRARELGGEFVAESGEAGMRLRACVPVLSHSAGIPSDGAVADLRGIEVRA